MRICLHTYYEISDPYIGGTQTLLIKLAKELMLLGHDVFIVCSSLKPQYIIEGVTIYGVIPDQYIHVLRTKYNGIASSKFLKDIICNGEDVSAVLIKLADYAYQQYSKFRPDVFHLNSYVAAFAYNLNIPVVAYQHENEFEFDGFWGNGAFLSMISYINRQKQMISNHPMLFTASQYYSEVFTKLLNLPILHIPLGVLLNDMLYIPQISYTEELSFDRRSSSIVILIPSRFNVKQKGQDLAIQACEEMLKKGYDIEVIFSGIKNSLLPEVDAFRAKYSSLEISSHIHFVSAYDMHELYKSVHIVLSPERYCSYGLSISEALSMGIPTILSDIPTYMEIASNYKHATFFRRDNIKELVSAIESVIISASKQGFRYTDEAIEFRINNDIRKTAIAFSFIYKRLLKQ